MTNPRKNRLFGRAALFGFLFVLSFWVNRAGAAPAAAGTDAPLIRDIRIEINDVFQSPDLGWFYRNVNNLKISTKEKVIRRELLFEIGDKFDPFLIRESERVLRAFPFIRQVSILPLPNGGFVDIIVSIQDTWTLFPQFTFSTGSGQDKQAIGLAESNLLGYGKRLEVLFEDDEGREKIEGVWDDPRLFGSYKRLLVGYFDRSDGYNSVVLLGRPFRSLVERTSWNISTNFSDTVSRLFENGDERFIFRKRHSEVTGRYILASGVPEILLHRYSIGYEFIKDSFKEADEDDFRDVDVDPDSVIQDPTLVADNRKFSGPFLAYQRIEPDFISINYIDRFERIEDFNLGNQFAAKANISLDTFGSLEDTLLFSISDSDGWRLSPVSFLRAGIGAASRITDTGFNLNNSLVHGEVKYYNVLGAKFLKGTYIGKHTLAAALSVDYGDDFDKDRELLLGASNGLRGYEVKTFTGDKRLVLNLEDRFHLVEDVFRLVNIGGAFFVDAGGTTTDAFGTILSDNLHGDVGFGLRFGFPPSTGGAVLRVDIAFPWRNGPDGSNEWEPRILVTTSQLFGGNLRSESFGPEKANVSVGLDD